MRIQKNGANMNQTVVTTMFWRVVQNYAAFVKVIEMYLYNKMIVLHLTRFPEMDHDKNLNYIF